MKKSHFLAFITVLIVFSISLIPFNAGAQQMQPIIGPGINLKTQLNASNDNRATWHNYSGDGLAKGETLTVRPGDEITLKLNLWNSDANPVTNVVLVGEADKPQYFDGSLVFFEPDLDGNHVPYEGDWDGSFSIVSVPGNGAEGSSDESGTMKFRVKSDAPDQTLITCVVAVQDYGRPAKADKTNNLLAKLFGPNNAKAQAGQAYSVIRILISNPAPLPQTGSSN